MTTEVLVVIDEARLPITPISSREVIIVDKARFERLVRDLDKWRNWKPSDETLAELKEQAKARDGSYLSSLAVQAAYIGGLEARLQQLTEQPDNYEVEDAHRELDTLGVPRAFPEGDFDEGKNYSLKQRLDFLKGLKQ